MFPFLAIFFYLKHIFSILDGCFLNKSYWIVIARRPAQNPPRDTAATSGRGTNARVISPGSSRWQWLQHKVPESELELSWQSCVSGMPLSGFRRVAGPNNDMTTVHNIARTCIAQAP